MTKKEYEQSIEEFYDNFSSNIEGLEELLKKSFDALESMKNLNRDCVGLISHESIAFLSLQFDCMIKALLALKIEKISN